MIEDQEHLEEEEEEAEEELAPAVDMGIVAIECADCGRPLLNMLKVRETEDVSKIKVICINKRCGPNGERGESWVHELQGHYFHSTIKKRDIITSMVEEDGIMVIRMDKT